MHKRAVLVKGDTKNVKPVLQALEGSWNKGLGGWVFPMKKREEVLAALRQDPTNTINEDPALVAEAAKAVKAEPVAEKRKSVDAADAPEARRRRARGERAPDVHDGARADLRIRGERAVSPDASAGSQRRHRT